MPTTRANGAEMDQLQQEVTQMAEILKNAVEDSEARIMKHIDVRTDALEDALKKYIDSVVFPNMATIAKQSQATPPVCHSEQPKQKPPPVDSDDVTETPTETLVITTTNSTDHQGTIPPGSVHPGTNNITSIHDKDVGLVLNGNRGLRSANADSKATPPPPGRLRAAVNTQSRHDVFIGNLSCSTNEDEIRAHLMDIGVESITSISKVLTKNENSCAMRVRINDNSILHNVYKIDNFEEGIIVKPFRFHASHTATRNAKNLSHQAMNHKNNHIYNNSQNLHTNQRYRRPRDEHRGNNDQTNTYNKWNTAPYTQSVQNPTYNTQTRCNGYAAAPYIAPVAVTPTAVTPAYPTTYQQPTSVQHQTSIPQTPAYDNTNLRIYPQPCVTNSQTVQQEPKQTGIYPPGTFINNNAGFSYYNTYPSLNHSQ